MKIEIKNAGLVWWVVDRYYPLLPQWCIEKQVHEDLEQEVYLIALEGSHLHLSKKEFLAFAQRRLYRFIKNYFFLKKRGRSWFKWMTDNPHCEGIRVTLPAKRVKKWLEV